MKNVSISDFTYYLPERVVDNAELAERFLLTPEHSNSLLRVTGIRKRRYCSSDENSATMAVKAIEKMFINNPDLRNQVDCIIVGTFTPSHFAGSTASDIIRRLGLHCPGFDIAAACCGWTFGIHQARALVLSGLHKNILVVGVDVASRIVDQYNHRTAVLFGDAAACCLVSESVGEGIINSKIIIESDNNDEVFLKTPFYSDTSEVWGNGLQLDGKKVYEKGVEIVTRNIKVYLKENNLELEDFDYFVIHQANKSMLSEIKSRLGVPDKKMLVNIEKVGNTAAASIPLCISQKIEEGIIKIGSRILCCAFGAGYTVGLIDTYL